MASLTRSRRVTRLRWSWVWALGWFSFACGASETVTFEVDVRTPAGENPFTTGSFDQVTIAVQQGTAPIEVVTEEAMSTFDVQFPILSLTAEIRATLELTGPTEHRIGAPPPFRASETGGLLQLIVAPPTSCAVVASIDLPTASESLGVARQGTFALVAGGLADDQSLSQVEFVDLLRMTAAAFPTSPSVLGPARVAPLGESSFVVVGDRAAFIYDIRDADEPIVTLSLHAGANSKSALAALTDGGVVVVGGGDAEDRSLGVTWVASNGLTTNGTLVAPRAGASLRVRNDGVLVIGGMAEGEPLVERIALDAESEVLLEEVTLGVRDDAIALANRDTSDTWVIGGVDASGLVRQDTWLISECGSDSCDAMDGPLWESARTDGAFVVTSSGGSMVGGTTEAGPSRMIDHFRFTETGVVLEPGPTLAHPRSRASAIAWDPNMILVLGGFDGTTARSDAELCVPDEL